MTRTLLPLMLLLAACTSEPASPPAEPAAEERATGLDRSQRGKPAPTTMFADPAGKEVSLTAFKGAPVLVNLWATWCAPCVKELPTLDRLEGVKVIAVSQDTGPQPSVAAFLETHKIANLGAYHDPKMALSGALGAQILPTTILYDGEGRELWRYTGDLDWTSAEAAKWLAEATSAPASS
jgi:thiol-disulfide isomerase/thioredoxin